MLATELGLVTKKKVGAVLLSEGLLSAEEVVKGLRYQAKKIFCNIFEYPDWNFKLTDVTPDASPGITPDLSLVDSVMTGIRSVDNISTLLEALPGKHEILQADLDQEDFMRMIRMTRDESLIILLIDGHRTLQDILNESKMLEYRFYKTLYPLLALKIVRVQRRPIEITIPETVPPEELPASEGVPEAAACALPPLGSSETSQLDGWFQEAKFFISTEQYSAAANRLKNLIRQDNRKSAYYYYLGLALDHIPGQNKEAEKFFKMAIKLENYNPRYYLALGYLYLNRNMIRQAREQFSKAAKWDASDPYVMEALESLGKLEKKGVRGLTAKLFGK
jgi:tetratricopeptide (TPR) repeat protein